MTNSDTNELLSSLDSTSLHTQLKIPWTKFSPSNIRLVPFPTREYTDDEFQSIVKRVMGVLYLLGFLYPISRLISYSVFEKEQKIKEGLYMMGLKNNMFYLSWFLTYALQVLHKETGVRETWSSIFFKPFWRKKSSSEQFSSSSVGKLIYGDLEENAHLLERAAYKPAVEAINFEMKQQELDGRCIQIRNLHKVYTSKKARCCAVNSLQLTLYENQILALLGHNGAGKSTTMSMLVGLVRPTSGDALVFGKNILTDMVKEHLEIFANIKGVNEDCLENVATEMAEEVIILDEPTSGMDPYSMRLTWQLIKRIKKGRIILLTTHSMDEADALGDRIAIMANGSLKCCGSSFFLKQQYGVGYTLTLVKATPNASAAADIVYSHIPSATCVSEVSEHVHGGWIQRFRQSTYRFPDPRRALDDAIEAAGPSLGPILLSMSEYLMSSYNESYQSRYGAVVMDAQSEDGSLGYTVLHNSSCQHAAPTYINLINSAILRLATLNENMTIQTRNHPLPMTKSQLQQRHDLDAFEVAVVVTIAFSFIPASFAVAIVKVSLLSYWASTYLWDFISFLFPSSFAIFLFCVFGMFLDFLPLWLDQFIGRDSLFSTVLMFLGYGLSIASSTYCLTFFFSEHSMAQNFFRLSPGFCFADGLASLALLRQGMKKGSGDSVFDWNVTGASISYLGAEVYPGAKQHGSKIAVHSLTFSVQEGECFGFLGTNGAGKTTTLSMLSVEPLQHNEAVASNENEKGRKRNSAHVQRLEMEVVARDGVRLVVGEERPTAGTAFIFGRDIRSDPKAARHHVVMEKLVEFDLLKHADKPAYALSGGNKRKLSVAIAMIGDPPVIILDEPSTDLSYFYIHMIIEDLRSSTHHDISGMDPIAKRFMWEVISRLSTRQGKTAVILTTHSMNEAQALCTRIGIMVGGKLRCIGSPQHLKNRFGNHLELELPYAEDLSLGDVFGHMERNRNALGISEYSISQSTLETIFNHFATNS
ncbi:UNVERIFIED_CONTAM: ABC transporter A family member 1 [Sesamum latifolium]|uniref:ABC transporter A family member 1 n=1 Tax=Sesamum latifolium TaxID=2727402 RepID=A0AAW2XLI7_9LAMI